ncbi:MAG: PQQ-binding-like beta-propeller repeat protein [Verrucomicrobiales bacterium]
MLLALVAPRCLPAQGDPNSAAAKALLDAAGLKGGFAVHLGAKDGSLAAGLGASAEALHVHGLVAEGADLGAARKAVQESGIYGRVSLDRLPPGGRLPYVDNMVNLIVADDANFMGIAPDEIQRALAPYGRAFYRDTKGDWKEHAAKPWPGTIDQWTHYLHDASGNAVAHDDEVGPPRHMQWLGSPRWSRHHDRMASMSALVSAKGKMFYIMDEGSRVSIQMPADWKLIARDGFNGVILWKRDIPQWQNHLWPLKSGPTHLARRLVAEGDRVYATLGMVAPVEALDALTGESVRTYAGSEGAEEIIKHGDLLFALVNRGAYELAEFAPLHNTGDQARVRKDFHWNEQARHIAAYDEATGEKRWELETKVAPLTLSANAERVYYHDGDKVVCLNRADGKQVWASEPATRRPALTFNFGPRLVVYKDTVLYAGGDRKMVALDAASGEKLWEGPHARSGYESPEDIIVSGGLVWVAPTTSGGDTGIYTGRDPRTGEVKSEFPPDVQTYWFHHRCYIAKATDKYLMPSRTGIEFVDYANKHWEIHHWVRGGCLYGVMPCNGLTYAPPHNCFCFPEAKLFGFNALAADSPTRRAPEMPAPNRLEKGPAFGAVIAAESGAADWPTYRADNQRSGASKSDVPADAREKWTADLQGRLSAVTVAAGRVYVARVDAHEVVALDEQSGAVAWRFTAGGRVDSPPTIWNGRAYFGGADGWVYCLRAADGELIWRFRAAPEDRRLFAFEQLESVWPVHGSALLEGGGVWFVAGRSYFLDGGIHLFKLDPLTGEVLLEKLFDDKNPETGNNLQEVTKTLQGPVGLPDILSCDGKFLYMRSQKFDFEGNRIDIAPVSGNSAEQGADQRGEGVHLFSPNGFLDSEWFHRAYWVYGKSFAGSHNGYYQAGKFTPGGRLLVHDGENVFGYGRKSQYLKWTTTIEHQLFSAPKEQPDIPKSAVGGPKQGAEAQRCEPIPPLPGLGRDVRHRRECRSGNRHAADRRSLGAPRVK